LCFWLFTGLFSLLPEQLFTIHHIFKKKKRPKKMQIMATIYFLNIIINLMDLIQMQGLIIIIRLKMILIILGDKNDD